MVTKKDICNILRNLIDDESIKILPNRIANKDEKAISVEDSTLVRRLPIHDTSMTFNQIAFKLNIRYSTNETETENFCWDLYNKLKETHYLEIKENCMWLKTLKVNEPYATGNVKNNIYEQRIDFAILYSIGG